ncbi:2-hydroxyacid dehydrogenase [Oscillibacter sp. MSJ-2]|uniref:2-hydroxyacid dehydrogenase n=1 Tax=Dysosmobacter acutus TaxID=2841504 RepID=A0ABS6FB26_9FIRM|nr:2-hydroxyacid dehydrogenase [Dysosmobacter acutus]MBU5626752.1 2-hydroxyacid dehydrogenase [Dysosmobacter acutus]
MMKIACLLSRGEGEKYHNQIKAGISRYIDKLGSYELVYDEWGEAMSYDAFSRILADIEHKGPEAVEIPASFFARHADAGIVIGSFTPFTGENMSELKNAHILGVMRAGLENIHIEDATKRGIAVINAIGRNADAVSDYAIGMMLSEARNIARSNHQIRSGEWSKNFPNSSCIPDMRGKVIGLFGFGQVGSRVARKLSGFDVSVLVCDPYIKPGFAEGFGCRVVDKDTLFRKSDFVSVHARLTADTFHVIGEEEFGRMKPTAYFINTARSGLVDYDALCRALAEKKIAGAAIDVFDEEPVGPDSPFLRLDNVTLTAHLAGATRDSSANTIRLVIDGIYNMIANSDYSRVLNPQVLETEEFKRWIEDARKNMGI